MRLFLKADAVSTLVSQLRHFPRAFRGYPGEFRTGPPIKTSGMTIWDLERKFRLSCARKGHKTRGI